MGPVQSLRLGEFIETHVHERNVGARRERHGLGNERVTRATVTLISGSVSCQGQASGGFSPASSSSRGVSRRVGLTWEEPAPW